MLCRRIYLPFLFLFSTRSRFLQQPDWLTYQFPLIRILGAIEKKTHNIINNKLLYILHVRCTYRHRVVGRVINGHTFFIIIYK